MWKRVRRVWAIVGTTVFIVFTTWSLLAYRSSADAKRAAQSGDGVNVTDGFGALAFTPVDTVTTSRTGFIFIAGALVDPVAYAPLARATAKAGFPSWIIRLPRRGAFGGAEDPALMNTINALMRDSSRASRWVVGGHSKGGVVASRLLSVPAPRVAGMILIGTSHPRDVDLSGLDIPVTKIVGTRDGLASREEVEANREQLPPTTNWVWIDGGNHSQFGWYGFQPGDGRATIDAAAQRAVMVDAVLQSLRGVTPPGQR